MRLFCVIGNDVCRYTESPALALRVERPFSRTTPIRVPAGIRILSMEAGRCVTAGRGAGATAGGAEVWGPSCSWASKLSGDASVIRQRNPPANLGPIGLLFMRRSLAQKLRCDSLA